MGTLVGICMTAGPQRHHRALDAFSLLPGNVHKVNSLQIPTANRTSLACKHFLVIKCLRMQDLWGFSEGVSSSESDLLKTVSKPSHPLKKQPHYGFRAAASKLRLGGGDWTLEAGERIQWLKRVATKPDHWSSVSCAHMVQGESWLLQVILCLHTRAVVHVCAHSA